MCVTGGSHGHLCCGNRVRHGSEQPYRKLPMLEGVTGLRRQLGSHGMKRAPTLRVSSSAKINLLIVCLYLTLLSSIFQLGE